jgi:hypothetical protein
MGSSEPRMLIARGACPEVTKSDKKKKKNGRYRCHVAEREQQKIQAPYDQQEEENTQTDDGNHQSTGLVL